MNKEVKKNKNKFELSLNSNIMEVIREFPGATEIFAKNGLPCAGCAAAQFEKLSDVVGEFGIDGDKLIEELKKGKEKIENKSE